VHSQRWPATERREPASALAAIGKRDVHQPACDCQQAAEQRGHYSFQCPSHLVVCDIRQPDA
jgi:hypothetical protein